MTSEYNPGWSSKWPWTNVELWCCMTSAASCWMAFGLEVLVWSIRWIGGGGEEWVLLGDGRSHDVWIHHGRSSCERERCFAEVQILPKWLNPILLRSLTPLPLRSICWGDRTDRWLLPTDCCCCCPPPPPPSVLPQKVADSCLVLNFRRWNRGFVNGSDREGERERERESTGKRSGRNSSRVGSSNWILQQHNPHQHHQQPQSFGSDLFALERSDIGYRMIKWYRRRRTRFDTLIIGCYFNIVINRISDTVSTIGLQQTTTPETNEASSARTQRHS